jgi:hypothetical protein
VVSSTAGQRRAIKPHPIGLEENDAPPTFRARPRRDPFIFALHPALIGRGTIGEILLTMLTASIGVVLLGIGCAGYLFRPLSWSRRAWAWAAAALLMMQPQTWLPPSVVDLCGLALGVLLVMSERRASPVGAAARDVEPSSSPYR